MSGRPFRSLPELAERLMNSARAGKVVRLTPETSVIVAAAVRAFATEPARDTIALAICNLPTRCSKPCMSCVSRANLVQRLYRAEPQPFEEPPDPGAGAPRRTATLTVVGAGN